MAKGLKFYEKSHRYKLDGQWVPGVTTIIGVLDKPAIPKWAAKSVAEHVAANPDDIERLRQMGERAVIAALKEIPWSQRDEAARRGTEVHDLAERYLQGEKIEVPEAIAGHVESCAQFIEDYNIQPVLVEAAVASREHQYAGKLDLIADHNRGPRAIFDWKTTKSGIYKETAFQTNAYAFAEFHGQNGDEHPMSELGIEAAYGVWLRPDGYDVYPLKFGQDVFNEFTAIRRVYDINKRANGDWRTPGSGYVGVSQQQEIF
ncbi:PD-(D/E)XK nuclease family protein [Bowdeniella massiliensis]|uniref:PD-(D/E)XK nuclease family protein n=1 Tax=Bowdeniella massiliensis TaxID=2932264 RepID=UPI0020284E94|nr:PD-(D/E)XK nuclease family protein [Bowdeniella massiliensis]